ncbi:MAG: HAD family acid phosphatase [Candidatus Melainabacteria bacterium]|nr:HAD family acid phosphatase [Candidatus Melainabacteria bacterium]
MKKIVRLAVLGATALLLPINAALAAPSSQFDKPADEPTGIGNTVGLEYSQSNEFKKLFSSAVADGRKACDQYLKDHPGASDMCIVSDLDETLLDNREHFSSIQKFDWDKFVDWVNEAKAPSLKPTANLLEWARKKGFAIFFVTGRPEELRSATIKNLVKNGIAYDGLYLRPKDDKRSAIEIKTAYRKQIEDMGFKVVVNIGDQVSDLVGGYAVDCEKLPNKIYFIN